MSNPAKKTPVMILFELTTKNKTSPPQFNLVSSKSGSHENVFTYEVTAEGITAVGEGRSKQVAKHLAAEKALKVLAELGRYNPESESLVFEPTLHRNEPTASNPAVPFNCIGKLQEICTMNKLPLPSFIEISDIGPPHCRQFTYSCQIGSNSIKTQATANTKKQAKQLAAKDMLDRIKDSIPNLILEEKHLKITNAITASEDEVIKKHSELSGFAVVDKSVLVEDFPLGLKRKLEEKGVTEKDLEEDLTAQTEDSFNNILKVLELESCVTQIQENPIRIILSLNLETPFAVFGEGLDLETAKSMAILQAFDYMRVFLQ